MQLTGNTGVERIELQGTLPDGAILQEAYKFFVEYRGDVMDDELTYELIKQLWVNGMIDNIGLLLPAFAKKQLSESGGRKVVDKMFDVSLNRRIVEWSDTDRPEFTDFGVSKVCVEAERENLVMWSEDFTEWSNATGGRNSTKENIPSHIHDGVLGRITSTAHQGGVGLSCPVPASSNHVFSFFIQRETAEIVRFLFENGATRYGSFNQFYVNLVTGNLSEVAVGGSVKVRPYADGWMVTLDAGESGSGDPEARLEFRTIEEGDVFRIGMPQLETGAYPTLYIPTSGSTVTRLAPTVPIEDALPLTGTVAGKVDMVRTVGITQYLIDNGGATGVDRFLLTITSGGDLGFMPFSDTSYAIQTAFPFDIDDNDRFTLEYAGSWDGENAYLFVRVGEEQYLYSGSYTTADNSIRDVEMGSRNGTTQSSMRWEILHHKDTIVRTTEEEFEQLFEVIS